jgi:hypothetical protein
MPDHAPLCLHCPGGVTCAQLKTASARHLVVSGTWSLTLAGVAAESVHPRVVLSRRRTSRATSRLGVRGGPVAEVVHRTRIAPAARSTCRCRYEYHDIVFALVEVSRSVVRHGGAQRVERLFREVLRSFDLRLDARPAFLGLEMGRRAPRPDAPLLELRRFADVLAFVPERVARSRVASFLRVGLDMRDDGMAAAPNAPLERFLCELAKSGVSAFDERPLDPRMRAQIMHRSRGETVWRPGREW